jgi:hypothetical protein
MAVQAINPSRIVNNSHFRGGKKQKQASRDS